MLHMFAMIIFFEPSQWSVDLSLHGGCGPDLFRRRHQRCDFFPAPPNEFGDDALL
jgi:hypothetical protein